MCRFGSAQTGIIHSFNLNLTLTFNLKVRKNCMLITVTKFLNDLQGAINVSRDFMGCSTLKKYYSQLQFLQSRFPLGDGGLVAVPFTW